VASGARSSLLCTSHPLDSTYIVPPSPSSPCSISYTSGTTSDPKGVVLTHANLTCLIESFAGGLNPKITISEKSHHFSYLPLAHIFERVVTAGLASYGGTISFIR
jgi:long-chain acyl-CoA synthetase